MTTTEILLLGFCALLFGAQYWQSLRYDRDRGNLERMLNRALDREMVLMEQVGQVGQVGQFLPFRPFRALPLTRAEVETVLAGAEANAGLAAVMQTLEEWIAKLNMEGHAGNELSRGGYVSLMRVYEELRTKMHRAAGAE